MAKVKVKKGQTSVNVSACIYPAVILHPSLGCPLIVDGTNPVSLIIVADTTFRDAFLASNGGDTAIRATGGPDIADDICQHLKVMEWDKAKELKKNIQNNDQPVSQEMVQKKNIACTYLGKLDTELRDAQGRHIANIRQSVIDQFTSFREDGSKPGLLAKYFSNDGLRYLFQIDLHDMALSPGTLYDSFWVLRNLHPKQDLDYDQKYLDIQDRIARDYIRSSYYKYAGKEGPLCAFKVSDQGVELTPDPNVPIQTRHPIYVTPPGKNKLKLGHLSDIHVSSKQNAYKGKQATVIPGADSNTSPAIGGMVNNNGDNFFDLLRQMSGQADLLIITGDLYDHLHNYDPAKLPENRTGKLWEAMYLADKDDVQTRNEEYPYGIDGLTVYSLLIHYYDKYKKPLFITCGNHEAYGYPYGISPRVAGKRANEGIPLDHNLTFYEAILLYGPGYKEVLKAFNFNSENFDWFNTLFTPLEDFTASVGDQCFVGLGWGEGETIRYVGGTLGDVGTLPRAPESPGRAQCSLVDAALAQGKETILCTHYTLVNYALEQPLANEGQVSAVTESAYDHGSSCDDRKALYEQWLGAGKLHLSLAGHSHRAGLYRCDYVPPYQPHMAQAGNNAYLQLGASMSAANVPAYLRTRGYHPEGEDAKNVQWDGRTKVLVSASAGPMPKQNLHGEMSGQGMESPSGSKVDAAGNIALVKSQKQTAKPRFCVACDYIDVMGKGFWEYFRATSDDSNFEMKPCWEKIHPRLSEDAKGKVIESMTLYPVEGTLADPITGEISPAGDKLRVAFEGLSGLTRPNRASELGAMFLSIKFNGSALTAVNKKAFDHYDYTSPWNIQVGIYADGQDLFEDPSSSILPGFENDPVTKYIVAKKRESLEKKRAKMGNWEIRRHKKFGEVPSLKWRNRKWKQEYACNLILKH